MLKIFKDFDGQHKYASFSDASNFLKSILIEVVAENYRHLMYEGVNYSLDDLKGESTPTGQLFNPPLRSRERVISGIFATAISRVSPRSYPEARIDRSKKNDDSEGSDENFDEHSSAGRVDYLSYYNGRAISCELKSGFLNADKIDGSSNFITEVTKKKWNSVVKQSKSAQEFLLKDENEYPNPISIALMTVAARRTLAIGSERKQTGKFDPKEFSDYLVKNMKSADEECPVFAAVYTFPEEFREFVRLKKGKVIEESKLYMPAIAFMARIAT